MTSSLSSSSLSAAPTSLFLATLRGKQKRQEQRRKEQTKIQIRQPGFIVVATHKSFINTLPFLFFFLLAAEELDALVLDGSLDL